MIRLDLTEFEIIVLRAALDRHIREFANVKHIAAAQDILKKSRAQDNPLAVLKGRNK